VVRTKEEKVMDENTYKSKNELLKELATANNALKSHMGDIRQLSREIKNLETELDNSIKVAKRYEEAMLAQQAKIEELEAKLVDNSGLFAPIGEEVEEVLSVKSKAKVVIVGTGTTHRARRISDEPVD
jgi:chromosome segregation ATPase